MSNKYEENLEKRMYELIQICNEILRELYNEKQELESKFKLISFHAV